jgi:hypothetical protein
LKGNRFKVPQSTCTELLAASKTDTLHMDTVDLSRESYDGIIVEAEKLTHNLTLHYGLLSYDCKDETEYIDKADKLTREIMQADDYELDDLFWGNPPDKDKLDFTLQKIIGNIEKIMKIPIEKRHYD